MITIKKRSARLNSSKKFQDQSLFPKKLIDELQEYASKRCLQKAKDCSGKCGLCNFDTHTILWNTHDVVEILSDMIVQVQK